MPRLMDMGLERLTKMLLDMAAISEKSVTTSIQAYTEGKNVMAQIHDWSEELRILQDEVSELSIELIARYQPVATDLRFIKACMEIAYGFSRFGRYAYDIAEVLEMWGDLSKCDHSVVEETARATNDMMRKSVEAFTKKDVQLARSIKDMDDAVDEMYRSHVRKMINGKEADSRCMMSATLILRYLERIADHSSYIGDSVVYIVTGLRTPRK